MAEIGDAEWAAAEERGRIAMATKPRATSARYDAATGRVVLDLVNGSSFTFPPRLVQGLENATDAQLAQVEILGVGFGLSWQDCNVDVTVEALLSGRFGSKRYMMDHFGPAWALAAAQ